jgi:hypothetical protein
VTEYLNKRDRDKLLFSILAVENDSLKLAVVKILNSVPIE